MEEAVSHKFIDILMGALTERVPVHTSVWWNLLLDLHRLAERLRQAWQAFRQMVLREHVPVETCALSKFCEDVRQCAGRAVRGTVEIFREHVPVETAGGEDLRWFLTILLPVALAVLLCLDKEMTPEKPEEPPVEPYRIEAGIDDLHGYRMVRHSIRAVVMAGKTSVYAARDRSSPVRLTLKHGARLNPEEASSQWVSVRTGGTEGFVPRKDLVLYDRKKKLIALTYDDGPDAWGTKHILDVFQRTHTRGTLFVLGYRINRDTAPLLKRATRMGCEIGNHSWDHAYLPGLKKKKIARQLGRTDAKVRELTGRRPRLVRPPYGALDRRVRKIAGRPLILWSVDTEDWRYRRTDRLIKYVRKHRRNGAVILMHDIHPSTVRAAEPIIRELKANGYQLVTVSELAAIRGEKFGAGTVYIGK